MGPVVAAVSLSVLPVAVVSLALFVVLMVITLVGPVRGRKAAWVMFFLQLIGLLILTMGGDSPGASGIPNLTPGATIHPQLTNPYYPLGVVNVVGNIAMFIPFGWLLALLLPRWRVIVPTMLGFALSISIEIVQTLTNRVGDIDDVILNGLGAFLGAVLGALVISLTPGWHRGRT